jgi:hypothetical protein
MIIALLAALAAVSPAKPPAHNWISPPRRPGESLTVKGYYDGNTLLDLCRRDDNLCIAYVVGVVDGQLSAIVGTSRTLPYCTPVNSTSGQVKDVVVKFLNDHPEERHLLGSVLVAEALSQAWASCPGSGDDLTAPDQPQGYPLHPAPERPTPPK